MVASDLTPAMVELGRARLAQEGYDVEWLVADVEDLPFEDGRFDCAASVFGAMFAPRPEVAASEMFRVVRAGGTVGLAAWTPDGFQGRVFAIGARYAPSAGRSAGCHAHGATRKWCGERLEGSRRRCSASAQRSATSGSPSPGSSSSAATPGRRWPRTRAMSDEDRAAMKQDVLAVIEEFNQAGDGGVAIDNEYLVIVARKRG